MSCGEVFCKSVSGIFSFVFTLASLAIMAFSAFVAYTIIVTTSSETNAKFFVVVPAIVTFALAVILFIALIMACCAMCQNSICCLDTYSIILIILALGNIGIGTYSLLTFKWTNINLKMAITLDVKDAMDQYPRFPDKIDNMQSWGLCCGTYGPSSYIQENKPYQYNGVTVPNSCCKELERGNVCTEDSRHVYKDGCGESIFNIVTFFNYVIGWAAIIIGVSEIVATIAAFYLSCMFWRGRMYNDW